MLEQERCYSRGAIFIPAMQDNEDLRENCSYYEIKNVKRLQQYQPRQHQLEVLLKPKDYDICSAELCRNGAVIDIGRDIPPLDICPFNDENSNWAIVGYGRQGNGRMIFVRGYCYNETIETTIRHKKRVFAEVFNEESLWGMSGGPWLPMSDKGKITLKAKGVQSTIVTYTGKDRHYAVSSYVTEEILRELGLR